MRRKRFCQRHNKRMKVELKLADRVDRTRYQLGAILHKDNSGRPSC